MSDNNVIIVPTPATPAPRIVVDPPIFCGFSSATGGFFSRALGHLIRDFTGGDVNHAFIVYWSDVWEAWITVGANINGVTEMTVPTFLETRVIKHIFAPVGFNLWDGLRAHVSDLDKHYAFTALPGMALVEIARKLGCHPRHNELLIRGEVFCSMWVAQLVRSAMEAALRVELLEPEWPFYRENAAIIDPTALCVAETKSVLFAQSDVSLLSMAPRGRYAPTV